jgi:hypothetical protein
MADGLQWVCQCFTMLWRAVCGYVKKGLGAGGIRGGSSDRETHTCTHTNTSGDRLMITTCSTILLLMPSSWPSCSEHYRDRFFSCLNIQPQFIVCYTKLWVEIAHPIASVSSAAMRVKATTKMVHWHGAAELPFSLSLSLVVRAFPVVVLRFLCLLGTVLEFHTWLIPIVAARDSNCNHQSCWFDSAKRE